VAIYSVDCNEADKHIPQHPERTVIGRTNPFTVYFQEFTSRAAMQRWLNKQSWEERQVWSPWMASPDHQRLLAIRSPRRIPPVRSVRYEQQSLFG
jgi:hypothetical protein